MTATVSTTIAVWGHYHGGNLGDDLVVSTVIDHTREYLPDATIIAISLAPEDTARRHQVVSYPINPGASSGPRRAETTPIDASPPAHYVPTLRTTLRRIPMIRWLRSAQLCAVAVAKEVAFLGRSYRLLQGVDLLVVAGSGQLLDTWGVWHHPYTTFRWAFLARLTRTRVVYASVGAGPFDTRLGAFFIRRAIRWADRVTARDDHSARLLTVTARLSRPPRIVPDMAFAMSDALLETAPLKPAAPTSAPIVGLNVMPHQDPRYLPHADSRRYDAYIEKMAALATWLLENGYSIRLFSSQNRADPLAEADVLEKLAARDVDTGNIESVTDKIDDLQTLMGVIKGCDLVIAARFHSTLIPLALGIPTLGLAYHAKSAELLSDAGYPDKCFDIDQFTSGEIIQAFSSMASEMEPVAARTANPRIIEHRAAVEQQFDEIFAGLPGRHTPLHETRGYLSS